MQEVQLKIKNNDNNLKVPLLTAFPKWVLQAEWKITKKTVKHLNTPAATSPSLCIGRSVTGASTGQPTYGIVRGTRQPRQEAATRIGGEEPRLAQNTLSTNCGG